MSHCLVAACTKCQILNICQDEVFLINRILCDHSRIHALLSVNVSIVD